MKNTFLLPKKAARVIVLQRIELASYLVKKLRKLLGRYIFTNFITKFFLNSKEIAHKYYNLMLNEFYQINEHLSSKDKIYLSIGGGLGGLESIINKKNANINFYFIERNYISEKIIYGWGGKLNKEAYNSIELQKKFLVMNGMNEKKFSLIDYDSEVMPVKKFDIVVSLYSLDYHYDFNIYHDYLKKISTPETKIIFDTIRPDYFKKIFSNVKVINLKKNTIHKSKRIVCKNFII